VSTVERHDPALCDQWLLPAFACALSVHGALRPALARGRNDQQAAAVYAEGCAMIAIAERVKAKADKPETTREAQEWDRSNRHYVTLGLCHVCAAQAAYGHQLGFARVNPPCVVCAGVVAGFPDGAANGWRSHSIRKASAGAYGAPLEREAYAVRLVVRMDARAHPQHYPYLAHRESPPVSLEGRATSALGVLLPV